MPSTSLFFRPLGIACLFWVSFVCFAAQTTQPKEKILVVATIAPIADWVRHVGGDAVDVVTLVPPGTSPHTFEPSPADLRKTSQCKFFVHVGLGLDNWVASLSRANPKAKVLAVGDTLLKKRKLPSDVPCPPRLASDEAHTPSAHDALHHKHDHDEHGGTDPHFWLDPMLAQLGVDEIEALLVTGAPEQAELWHKQARRYRDQLADLHQAIAQRLRPCRGQKLVTFHHAFGYFAQRYGLEIVGVIEQYPGRQPSEREIKALVKKLRELDVQTIFAEPQMDIRLAQIVANEIGGKVGILDPEGTADRQNYLQLMQFNAQQIQQALCP